VGHLESDDQKAEAAVSAEEAAAKGDVVDANAAGAGGRGDSAGGAVADVSVPHEQLAALLEAIRGGLNIREAAEVADLDGQEVAGWKPESDLGKQLDEAIEFRNLHNLDWPLVGRRGRRRPL